VFQLEMWSPHAVYMTLSYAWWHFSCLAIDLLLILIVDGISKNILLEIRSLHRQHNHMVNTVIHADRDQGHISKSLAQNFINLFIKFGGT